DAAARLQLVRQHVETGDAQHGAVADVQLDPGDGAEELDRPKARLEHTPAGPQREADALAFACVAHGTELLPAGADAQRLPGTASDSAFEQVGGPHELGD